MTTKKAGSGSKGKKRPGKGDTAPPVRARRTWLRVAGIVFLAVWMFVLGVLVGRGTAPVRFDIQKLQKELAALKAAALERGRSSREAVSGDGAVPGGIDPTDLDFYEDLRASRSRLNFKPAAVKKTPPESTAQAAARTQKPSPAKGAAGKAGTQKTARHTSGTAGKKPAQETATGHKVDRKPAAGHKVAKAAPKPATKAPASRQRLTLQVASVKNQAVAERMVRDLKKKGYPAYTRIGKVPGRGIWYRVRVGRFTSRRDAAGMQARLRRDKWKAVIVSR